MPRITLDVIVTNCNNDCGSGMDAVKILFDGQEECCLGKSVQFPSLLPLRYASSSAIQANNGGWSFFFSLYQQRATPSSFLIPTQRVEISSTNSIHSVI